MFFLGVGQFWLQFPLSVELSQIRIPSSTKGLDQGALPEHNPVENAEQPEDVPQDLVCLIWDRS